jgi:hypothetical protein
MQRVAVERENPSPIPPHHPIPAAVFLITDDLRASTTRHRHHSRHPNFHQTPECFLILPFSGPASAVGQQCRPCISPRAQQGQKGRPRASVHHPSSFSGDHFTGNEAPESETWLFLIDLITPPLCARPEHESSPCIYRQLAKARFNNPSNVTRPSRFLDLSRAEPRCRYTT